MLSPIALLLGISALLGGCGGGSASSNQSPPPSTVATPTFSPAAGTYSSTQSVTISDSTSGATVYYTTDGSTPTASSTKYTAAITVSSTETISAIAVASGYNNSAVASAAYTISLTAAATPTFSPAAGTYVGAQSVTISDTTANAIIYYTTDGSTPTASSTKYSGAITVSVTETIEAIATASGYANSAVASASYTITPATAATPTFSPAAGTYSSAQSVTISDATTGAAIYYTTDGSTPTTSSTKYAGAIPVSSTETINAIAVASGYSNSTVASATYTIDVPAATPSLSPPGGTYTTVQSVMISDTTPNATIYYTTDGSTPTTNSTVYNGAITVSASETINAIAVASGYSNSAVASASYLIALADPETNFFTNIWTIGNSVTINLFGVVQGATANPGNLNGNNNISIVNPDGGSWTNPQTLVGAQRTVAAANATGVSDTFFMADLTTSATKIYSFQKVVSNISSTNNTLSLAIQPDPTAQGANFVSLPQPFPLNTDGTAPAISSGDTGNGLVVASGSSVYFIPKLGATLNQNGIITLIPPQPSGTPVGNPTLQFDDSTGNFAVIRDNANGATPRVDMYDQNGNWLLSGPAGLVLPDSMTSTTASVIPFGVDVAGSVNISPTLNQTISLYFAQQAAVSGAGATQTNVGSLYIQPGTNGGQPTATPGTISNPNGGPFGPSIAFMTDMPTASGTSPLLFVADVNAKALWHFNMAPVASGNAQALQATMVGSTALDPNVNNFAQSAGLVAATGNIPGMQVGIYLIAKNPDGSLDSPIPAPGTGIGNGGILFVGAANDASRNFFVVPTGNGGNTMISGVKGENILGVNAVGVGWVATTTNPTVGDGVFIANVNGSVATNTSAAAQTIKPSFVLMAKKQPLSGVVDAETPMSGFLSEVRIQ